MIRRNLLLALATVLLLVTPSLSLIAGGVETPTASHSLSVTVTPAKLPADGGQYPAVVVSLLDKSGLPSLALSETNVFLSSSQTNVGSVPSSVVIPAGKVFVMVNFTTTTTAGQTAITVSSPGLASFSAPLVTVVPSGFATHLNAFATPGTLVARPTDKGTITVELTDDQGLPSKAPADLTVHLFSSSNDTASLDQTNVVIKADETFATGTFHTAFRPGAASITASSSGFISGGTTINVVGPAPLKLVAQAQPQSLALSSSGRLVISLTDQSGEPARAPTPISISITSSNLTVAQVQATATIPAGWIYTVVSYSSTSIQGTATLTATSPGLESSSSVANTFAQKSATALKVFVSPSPTLSDNQTYSAILVALVGSDGNPAVAVGDVLVQLTSSSSVVGSVPSSIIIPGGASYTTANFRSTFASGTTVVTASASNLLPDLVPMTTFGPVPVRIALGLNGFSSTLPADGAAYSVFAVSLSDSTGAPAVAPNDIVIQLSSSRADIVSVDTSVVIRQGSIATIARMQTTLLAGLSNISASSVGLSSGTIPVTTVIPAPAQLKAFVAPPVALEPKTGNWPILFVQLQDSGGNPARARHATGVVVTSSNSVLLNSSISLTIPAGADYVSKVLMTDGLGSGTLTASSSGLAPSSANLQVLAFPVSANVTLSKPFIFANQTAIASATVTFLGTPLRNASIIWLADGGLALPSNGTTNSAGQATTTFRPNGPGQDNITLIVQVPALGDLQFRSQLTVLQVPPKPAPTIIQIVLSYIYYIVAAVVAVIVALVYLFRLRRRKAKAELEAGFEAVS